MRVRMVLIFLENSYSNYTNDMAGVVPVDQGLFMECEFSRVNYV